MGHVPGFVNEPLGPFFDVGIVLPNVHAGWRLGKEGGRRKIFCALFWGLSRREGPTSSLVSVMSARCH